MSDFSVYFANIQSIVNQLADPLKTELADAARGLQEEIDSEFESVEERTDELSERARNTEADKDRIQRNNRDLESRLSDLEYERDRQVRDLESKISDLEREKQDLEYRLRKAEDDAHQARNRYY